MGPTLALRVMKAFEAAGFKRSVDAVLRFSEASQREELEVWGATTIAADLFDEVLNELPSCWNVVYRIGSKFGAVGNESETWASNAVLAGRAMPTLRTSARSDSVRVPLACST